MDSVGETFCPSPTSSSEVSSLSPSPWAHVCLQIGGGRAGPRDGSSDPSVRGRVTLWVGGWVQGWGGGLWVRVMINVMCGFTHLYNRSVQLGVHSGEGHRKETSGRERERKRANDAFKPLLTSNSGLLVYVNFKLYSWLWCVFSISMCDYVCVFEHC